MHPPHAWTEQEEQLLKHLAACKLSPSQIGDAFAIIGWDVRNERTIQRKGYAMGVKWQGDPSRG